MSLLHHYSLQISIHAPHTRSDATLGSAIHSRSFQSTLLIRGATNGRRLHSPKDWVFQSTLLIRGATHQGELVSRAMKFQSTLLIRGATCSGVSTRHRGGHFNPRSSYEERLVRHWPYPISNDYFNPRSSYEERPLRRLPQTRDAISIHAPHTRSDPRHLSLASRTAPISIHAPHTRSDLPTTPFVRSQTDFNPRSSYEERPHSPCRTCRLFPISIHAPHTRSDTMLLKVISIINISIHAPHTRSDPFPILPMPLLYPFQSTLLIRGATAFDATVRHLPVFQSTLLIRGATTR